MKNSASLRHLSFRLAPLLPCGLGEMTGGQTLWDMGGTETLARFRRVPDLHLLVMCLEGRSDYRDENGVTFTIHPGEAMLIPRGLAHTYRPTPGHGWSEICAWLRGPLPDLWLSSRFLGPGTTLLRAEPLAMHARRLCDLLGTSSISEEQRLSQFQSWLAGLKASTSNQPSARNTPWLSAARMELEGGTMRRPDLARLARRLGVSYESFRKIFAAEVGVSPGKYRLASVIQRACRLLRTNRTLKEITDELEFSDEFHFSSTFRRAIGIPPGQYRSMTKSAGAM